MFKKIALAVALFVLTSVVVFAQQTKDESKAVPLVSRHSFTSSIVNREPSDHLTAIIAKDVKRVTYFSELNNMQNLLVKHIWKVNNHIVYTHQFKPAGSRWRVNSSINSSYFKPGDIVTVEVTTADNTIYAKDALEVN